MVAGADAVAVNSLVSVFLSLGFAPTVFRASLKLVLTEFLLSLFLSRFVKFGRAWDANVGVMFSNLHVDLVADFCFLIDPARKQEIAIR